MISFSHLNFFAIHERGAKMKRKFMPLFSIILVLVSAFAPANNPNTITAELINYKIVYSGAEKETEVLIYNNRTYVPLREISENIGQDVEWVGDSKMITIDDKGKGRAISGVNPSAFADGYVYQYYDWTYYCANNTIFKQNDKTGETQSLVVGNSSIYNMFIRDGQIFYWQNQRIMRMNMQGEDRQILYDGDENFTEHGPVTDFKVFNDCYVFLSGGIHLGKRYLTTYNFDSETQTILKLENKPRHIIGKDSDDIYYFAYETGVVKYNIVTLKEEIVIKASECGYRVLPSEICMRSNNIYYMKYGSNSETTIIEYDMKTGQTNRITESSRVFGFNVDGNNEWIYYSTLKDFYKVKTDGTENTFVSNEPILEPKLTDKYVYACRTLQSTTNADKIYRISISGGEKEIIYDSGRSD